jgi:hypothetical protein
MSKIFTIISIALAFFVFAPKVEAATATGTIESAIFGSGYGLTWQEMSWTASTTASSTITMKVRTSASADMSGATAWSSCTAVSNGADISANNCVTDGHPYIQYYAFLSCDYAEIAAYATPELFDVQIKYNAVGILTSSIYHTGASDAELVEARWTETLPGGTNIAVQLRSSSDALSWSDWLGPDGTAVDFFVDNTGLEDMPTVFTDGAGERYFQYRVLLDSGGTAFPTLSDITIDYTASVPVISSYSPPFAGSNASGTISLVIHGEDFLSGATLEVSSRDLDFEITAKSQTSDSMTFDLDTSIFYGGPLEFTITNPDGASVVNSDFYINEARGTFDSEIKDLFPHVYYNFISWTDVTSASSSVWVRVRTDSVSNMSGAEDWADCDPVTNGSYISANSCVTEGDRYVQYQLELGAAYGTSSVVYFTPELTSISLVSTQYVASGTLVSSPYNTGSAENALRILTWTDTKPTNTDVVFQIRTAPDAAGSPGTWSTWFGPFATDYYRDFRGKNGINIQHNDGVNDQWLQYRAILSSDGQHTPILFDTNLEYGDKLFSAQIIKDNMIFQDGMIFR